ncbi:S8 family peptidase [Desulfuromonas carbonis]|uniref:S8 family serine peptidase n=1 Tax=Desulfuromonas sp. DDH964 TaxID=1823759 RepID=UPI00078DECC9|nr:S8 family serine peptidase [Desulfuromonas sp. DDH964]AMV72482.1 subtilase family serine protease [Desulfuromonas sp. DDH964]
MAVVGTLLLRKILAITLLLLLAGCGDNTPTKSLAPVTPPPVTTYSLSGTITAAAGSAVDGDTNDPAAPLVANNLPDNAQQLPNPVVLGGYSTFVATGQNGDRFVSTRDEQDWYRMTLAAGQTISLTIADHDGNPGNLANPDLDLFLVDPVLYQTDPANSTVQSSEGHGPQETILVQNSGDYYVQVFAFNSGSNYTLTVGQAPAMVNGSALHIEDEFVPGEVIVRFRENADGAGITPQAASDRAAALGLDYRAGRPGAPMLFRQQVAVASPRTLAITPEASSRSALGVPLPSKRATLDLVKSLRRRADVVSADLNYIRRSSLVPNDTLFSHQWNAELINLPQAWELTTGNPAVVVAVLDTGVLMNHPDLAGRLCTASDDCRGYDLIADPIVAGDGDGIDPDPEDVGDKGLPDGSSGFHGTHIAGIAGAAGNNGTGIAGVDWAARIMPIRTLGIGGGTSYDVMQGVLYAAGLANDSGAVPAKPADVINLSLGGGGASDYEQAIFTQVRDLGIIVVAAAGNAHNLVDYPAALTGVVAVSAVDIDKKLAPYSNFGAAVDIAAPGGDSTTDRNGDGFADGVISTCGDDHTLPVKYTYVPYQGTSMATPHVAAVAGLMKGEYPALTPAEFDTLLAAGSLTEDLGGDGPAVRNDSFGYGLIDAQKSVLAAIGRANGGTLPASLAISPSYLNFGAGSTSLSLTLSNSGGGVLNVTAVTPNASWLTVDASAVPHGGLGTYTINIDRTGLTSATYAATLTIVTDQPASYPVTVLMQVGASGIANAGFQHIELVDAASGSRLTGLTKAADPVTGTYSYSFTGVPPGNYLVRSGTDSDHDGQICDPGESCGAYPLRNNPSVISVTTGNRTGLDFSSSF